MGFLKDEQTLFLPIFPDAFSLGDLPVPAASGMDHIQMVPTLPIKLPPDLELQGSTYIHPHPQHLLRDVCGTQLTIPLPLSVSGTNNTL